MEWSAAQGLGSELTNAFRNGTFNLVFRHRYEFADDDGFEKNANVSTLRTRLLYSTAPVRDFALTVNLDNVSTIGPRDYNSTRNGKTDYPIIPDP